MSDNNKIVSASWDRNIDCGIILSNLPGYIFWKDINSVYHGCNHNFAILHGLKSAVDIVGQTDHRLYDTLADQLIEHDRLVLESRSAQTQDLQPIILHNKPILFRLQSQPIYDLENNLIGLVTNAFNLIDYQQKDSIVIEDLLEQQHRRFERLVRQTSHSVKSPIATLLLAAKYAAKDIPESIQNIIIRVSNNITNLINNLHAASAGGVEILEPRRPSSKLASIANDIDSEHALGDKKRIKADLVIVDDDEDFANVFAMFTFKNKIVDQYYDPHCFLDNVHKYSKDTRICLDNNFDAVNITGIDIAKKLHDMGYKKLYLISGTKFLPGQLPDYLRPISKVDINRIDQIYDS